jgi:hypothetical protein
MPKIAIFLLSILGRKWRRSIFESYLWKDWVPKRYFFHIYQVYGIGSATLFFSSGTRMWEIGKKNPPKCFRRQFHHL